MRWQTANDGHFRKLTARPLVAPLGLGASGHSLLGAVVGVLVHRLCLNWLALPRWAGNTEPWKVLVHVPNYCCL